MYGMYHITIKQFGIKSLKLSMTKTLKLIFFVNFCSSEKFIVCFVGIFRGFSACFNLIRVVVGLNPATPLK